MLRNIFRGGVLVAAAFALIACDSDGSVRSPDLPQSTLNSIAASCTPGTIAEGETGQCTASCTYNQIQSNGNVVVTPPGECRNINWRSADSGVVSIDPDGVYTGVSPGGPVDVDGCSEGQCSNLPITVEPETLNSIAVNCTPTTIAVGMTGQCTASCTYNRIQSDGSAAVTPPGECRSVDWRSAGSDIVSIDDDGVYTGVSPGGPVDVGGCSEEQCDDVPITVSPACPVAGQAPNITPASQELPRNARSQLQAFVNFTDGSTVDVAREPGMDWSSADPDTVSVCNTDGGCGVDNNKGTATAAEVGGPVTITGTYTQANCAAIPAGTAEVTVLPATLIPGGLCVELVTVDEPDFAGCRPDTGACLTTANLTVPLGGERQFRARGRFNDGQECSLTETAEWSASDANVLEVNNTSNKGVASGVGEGNANVVASFADETGEHPLSVVVELVLASNSLEVGMPIDSNQDGMINDDDTLAKFFCVGYADAVAGLADSSQLPGNKRLQARARFCPQHALLPNGSCDPAQLLSPSVDVTQTSAWGVPNSFWDGRQCVAAASGNPLDNQFPAQVNNTAPNKGAVTPRGGARFGTACIQADYVNPADPANSAFDGATALVLPITNDVLTQDSEVDRAVALCNTLAPLFLLGGNDGGAGQVTELLAVLAEIINPLLTALAQGNEPGGELGNDDLSQALIELIHDEVTAQLFADFLQEVVNEVNDGVYAPLNCALGAVLNAILTQDPDSAAQAIDACPPESGGGGGLLPLLPPLLP